MIMRDTIFVYAVTLILCTSSLLDPIRQWIIMRTPWAYSPLSTILKDYTLKDDAKHFVECRLCVGVWLSLACCLFHTGPNNFWIVFGLSYFLATQER